MDSRYKSIYSIIGCVFLIAQMLMGSGCGQDEEDEEPTSEQEVHETPISYYVKLGVKDGEPAFLFPREPQMGVMYSEYTDLRYDHGRVKSFTASFTFGDTKNSYIISVSVTKRDNWGDVTAYTAEITANIRIEGTERVKQVSGILEYSH